MFDLISKLVTPKMVARTLEAAVKPDVPLFDALFPRGGRYHPSIKIALDSLIKNSKNQPHTVRGGAYKGLENQNQSLLEFVPPPIRLGTAIDSASLNEIEEFYNLRNQRGIEMKIAEIIVDLRDSFLKSAEAMAADFIYGAGTMAFPIYVDGQGVTNVESVDYPLKSYWQTATATLKWDASTATIATVMSDMKSWTTQLRNAAGQGGPYTIVVPDGVFGVLLDLAQANQTTSQMISQANDDAVKIGMYTFIPISGTYYSYALNVGASYDLLEAKKIHIISNTFQREVRYCKTEMRDDTGALIPYNSEGAPFVLRRAYDPRSEQLAIKGESKPVPVMSPASFLTATVLT